MKRKGSHWVSHKKTWPACHASKQLQYPMGQCLCQTAKELLKWGSCVHKEPPHPSYYLKSQTEAGLLCVYSILSAKQLVGHRDCGIPLLSMPILSGWKWCGEILLSTENSWAAALRSEPSPPPGRTQVLSQSGRLCTQQYSTTHHNSWHTCLLPDQPLAATGWLNLQLAAATLI